MKRLTNIINKHFNIKPQSLVKIIFIMMFALTSCGPQGGKSRKARVLTPDDYKDVEYDVTSTLDAYNKLSEEDKKNYDAPPEVVKNGKDAVYIGFTKLKNIKSVYNKAAGVLEVSGTVDVYKKDKQTLITSKDFRLKGQHTTEDSVFALKPIDITEDARVDKSAVTKDYDGTLKVRAKVTCFDIDENDNVDCSNSIIDLYFKAGDRYFTDQVESKAPMKSQQSSDIKKEQPKKSETVKTPSVPEKKDEPQETAPKTDNSASGQSTRPQQPPVSNSPGKVDENNQDDDEETGIDEEGDDESIPGRYEGTVTTVNLPDLFDVPKVETSNSKNQTASATSTVSNTATVSPTVKPSEGKPQAPAKTPPTTTTSPQKPANTLPSKPPVQPQPAPTPSPIPVPSKTEATKEQVIDLNFKIDRSGNVIRHNQAFGSYSGGYLRNASSLKEQQDSFNQKHLYYFHDNGRYYGTQEAVEIVQLMGKKIYQAERNKIYVSRIAAQRGGLIRPSKSHQNGLDIDIGYPTKSGKTKFPVVVASGGSKIISSDYSPAKTLELFKFLVTQKQYPVSRLFVDRHIIKNLCSYARETKQTENNQKAVIAKVFSILQHVDGHGNHFHLRLKCDSKRHKCLDVYYSKHSICTTSSMVVK